LAPNGIKRAAGEQRDVAAAGGFQKKMQRDTFKKVKTVKMRKTADLKRRAAGENAEIWD